MSARNSATHLVHRRRRVRFEYPPPVQRLARAVTQRLGRRSTARAMDLPISTIYRWCGAGHTLPHSERRESDVEDLVTACERLGFSYRDALRACGFAALLQAPAVAAATQAVLSRGRVPALLEQGDAFDLARNFIERCYYRTISCDLLAAHAQVSKFHFIKRFRDRFGSTPHRYLQRVRIEHACRLLEVTSPSLGAIATAVGYNDVSTFMKAFRAQRGETVSHYAGLCAQPAAFELAANA